MADYMKTIKNMMQTPSSMAKKKPKKPQSEASKKKTEAFKAAFTGKKKS